MGVVNQSIAFPIAPPRFRHQVLHSPGQPKMDGYGGKYVHGTHYLGGDDHCITTV
jgi:hypothetical protein